jgi:hypothetical protein
MNLSTIAQTLGVEDFTLCEVCDNYTPNCAECASFGEPTECDTCHKEYGCLEL